MLKYDSISTLKDDINIMKIEIKKLAAVTFSALGILACSSASFCNASSVGSSNLNKRHKNLKKDTLASECSLSWLDRVYIACPEDKVEIDMFHGNIKQLIYPIGTFDVNRFYRVIHLNQIDKSWNFYMADNNDENPAYGFCIIFAKGPRSVSFFFNPMEMPEKFAGSSWNKDGFSLETFFDNFEKFVESFGFEEKRSYSKMSTNCRIFQVPIELTYLSNETFRNFSNLKRIVIPATVEDISQDAFKDCKKLESIFYMGRNYFNVDEFMKDFNRLKKLLRM